MNNHNGYIRIIILLALIIFIYTSRLHGPCRVPVVCRNEEQISNYSTSLSRISGDSEIVIVLL